MSNHYLEKKESNSLFHTILITLSVILMMDMWSYMPYLQTEWKMTYIPRLLFFLFLGIIVFNKRVYKNSDIDKICIWTIITIFVSSIPAYLDYKQTFLSSFSIISYYFYGFLLYFVLRRINFSIISLTKIVCFVSVVWVVLEIGQQFTYPHFWFSGRYLLNDSYLENRMGLWRYYIWGVDFVMLAFALYWGNFIEKYNKSNKKRQTILLAVFFMVGLMCYGSRKHIYSVIVVFVISFLNVGKRKRWKYLLFLIIVAIFIYTEFYESFVEMNSNIMKAQGDGNDFIRVLASSYFLFDFSDSPLYPLWGAGIGGATGELSIKIDKLADVFGFYQADCGIIGYYSQTGMIGISAILYYIYIVIRDWRYIDYGYRYFFIMKMILILFDFWAMWNVGMAAYAVYLYLLHKNIEKNKYIRKMCRLE